MRKIPREVGPAQYWTAKRFCQAVAATKRVAANRSLTNEKSRGSLAAEPRLASSRLFAAPLRAAAVRTLLDHPVRCDGAALPNLQARRGARNRRAHASHRVVRALAEVRGPRPTVVAAVV